LRSAICILRCAICILRCAICILRCNMDNFLLNQKGLVLMSILPKKLCNMHIACRNMHIVTESTLGLTHIGIEDHVI
jgi:hypothetical protein